MYVKRQVLLILSSSHRMRLTPPGVEGLVRWIRFFSLQTASQSKKSYMAAQGLPCSGDPSPLTVIGFPACTVLER